ncbi:hypothetical protein FB565_007803 [Actinoplanes lutulentus]|uniref:Lipoprotein n=1 Tax=Actinoplanes lutulentus TaxID=1287878 RepID=A0A327ZLJ6_9ACTN|nr:hypothetical protein [Actinoplanes lutulentus]MBB2948032.1 hypothetical protein [Actinoplanes lutulentus]RAK40087.1 hypothetical protein B0I29_103113 [Actinoplanes lutulentus]
MIRNRIAAAGTLLLAGTTLAACAATGTESVTEKTTAAQSPAPTVSETLLDAVPDESSPAFHYTVKGGVSPFSGVIDPAGKALTAEIAQKVPDTPITLSMKFLVIEEKIWTKIAFKGATADMGLPKLPKKWMSLDPAKTEDSFVTEMKYSEAEVDPGSVAALVSAADDLKETTPGHYAGTTDLTKSTEAEIVEGATLTALGEKAKGVPLEVVVDGEGRISTATVKIPAAGKTKASTYKVTYDQYGSAASLEVPADAVKATADVYDLLKG